jgi:hypothetical protein
MKTIVDDKIRLDLTEVAPLIFSSYNPVEHRWMIKDGVRPLHHELGRINRLAHYESTAMWLTMAKTYTQGSPFVFQIKDTPWTDVLIDVFLHDIKKSDETVQSLIERVDSINWENVHTSEEEIWYFSSLAPEDDDEEEEEEIGTPTESETIQELIHLRTATYTLMTAGPTERTNCLIHHGERFRELLGILINLMPRSEFIDFLASKVRRFVNIAAYATSPGATSVSAVMLSIVEMSIIAHVIGDVYRFRLAPDDTDSVRICPSVFRSNLEHLVNDLRDINSYFNGDNVVRHAEQIQLLREMFNRSQVAIDTLTSLLGVPL